MMNYRTATYKRDYANQKFGTDLSYILQSQMNNSQVIDFGTQLFNKLMRWGTPNVQPRQHSLNYQNMGERSDKFPSYPMVSVNNTYVSFQGLLDTAYLFVHPVTGDTFNPVANYNIATANFNYVMVQCGLHLGPVFPYAGDLVASDAVVLQVGPFATPSDWETAYNTLLRPYENTLNTQYLDVNGNPLFPIGGWPYIRETASLASSGAAIFRLSPAEPNPALIGTSFSTGEHNHSAPGPRGPFVGPTRPYRISHPSHIR